MSEILIQSVLVALIVAFIILFLGKTGAREYLRDYHDRIGATKAAEMFECDFCLSFWTCLLVMLGFWLFDIKVSPAIALTVPPIVRLIL